MGGMTVILGMVFGAVTLFTLLGAILFTKKWETYEEKYLQESERTLQSIFLSIPPQQLLYISFVVMICLGTVLWFMFESMAMATTFALPGFFAPHVLLWYLKKARVETFGQQLVDTLDNLSNSLKAGYSLPQCFELVAREGPAPISQEFRILNRELRLGLPMDQALKNMHTRMPTEDLDLVVTAVLISRELGGNLTEVFENIANVIRERFKIEGKIKSLSSQGKLQGIIVSSMPGLIGYAIHKINPELMRPMYTTLIGWGLIVLIAVLIYLGYYFIQKICNIDV